MADGEQSAYLQGERAGMRRALQMAEGEQWRAKEDLTIASVDRLIPRLREELARLQQHEQPEAAGGELERAGESEAECKRRMQDDDGGGPEPFGAVAARVVDNVHHQQQRSGGACHEYQPKVHDERHGPGTMFMVSHGNGADSWSIKVSADRVLMDSDRITLVRRGEVIGEYMRDSVSVEVVR